MSATRNEISSLLDALPPDKAQSVLDYARFLVNQVAEQAWDASFVAAAGSAAFGRELEEVRREIAAGQAIPLRVDDL